MVFDLPAGLDYTNNLFLNNPNIFWNAFGYADFSRDLQEIFQLK